MDRCKICKEFIYSFEKHKCEPKWLCKICESDDDKYSEEERSDIKWFEYEVYAFDAERAAEKCAEDEDPNWDHLFVQEGGVDIDVMNPETKEIKRFFVGAEPSIEYSASERKEEVKKEEVKVEEIKRDNSNIF